MGSCGSVISSNEKFDNVRVIKVAEKNERRRRTRKGKKNEKKRREEKTGAIKKKAEIKKKENTARSKEIHKKLPSRKTAWGTPPESRKNTGKKAKRCASLEVVDIEENDELTDEQNKAGRSDIQRQACASEYNPGPSTSTHQRPPQRGVGHEHETSNVVSDRPGTSTLYRRTKFTAPLPPPSEWHRVYTERIKHKEQLAHESLAKEPKKKPEPRTVTRENRNHAYKISLLKRIKKSIMKSSKNQGPDTDYILAATNEYFSRIFGINTVELQDDSDSSSSSSSSSSDSSRSTSPESQNYSEADLNEQSIGRFFKGGDGDHGEKRERKSRRWFGLRNNRVVPQSKPSTTLSKGFSRGQDVRMPQHQIDRLPQGSF